MTRISAATAAWLSGVAEAEAETEMAVDDMLGVVTDTLVETGADATADEEVALETADEADELTEELPEYETAELEAEPDETGDDPLSVGMLEEEDETVTITDSDGISPDEVKVTKVDTVEVLGTIVLDELPIGVDDSDTETETEGFNECVEVASVVELTPTELLGVLEGVKTGG